MSSLGIHHKLHLHLFLMDPVRPPGPPFPIPPHMQESDDPDVVHYFFPFFRVFKDGRIERFLSIQHCPPSNDPTTGVCSKDVLISPETGVSARIFLPKIHDPTRKLPLLLYIHGGGFSIESAFSSVYHNYLSSLVAKANVIAVSVEYRLAPEHPIPACYEDSWEALKWVGSHANGDGPESWINNHADLGRVFVAGDSAGGNITHTTVAQVGSTGLPGLKVVGAALVHPFFGGPGEDYSMWKFICPTHGGLDDPRLKPAAGDLARLGCEKVLIFVAKQDHLRERGVYYYEELKKSGWQGTVEIEEHEGEDHVFHLFNPDCDNAVALMKKLISFINHGGVDD